MFDRLYLYWRWLKIKRVKVRRYIEIEMPAPAFSTVSEKALGDNFPVLASTFVRTE